MRRTVLIALLAIANYFPVSSQKITPVYFTGQYNGEFSMNHTGTYKSNGYYGKVDALLHFESDRAGWWKGGKVLIHGVNIHGDTPSFKDGRTWDLQPASRIEAGPRTGLFEFWFRQSFKKSSITIGQHDMNSEFATNPYSGNLRNTSFGMFPSIALVLPLSIYPSGHEAILVKYFPHKKISFQTAVYNGQPHSFKDNEHNIRFNLNHNKVISISEVQYHNEKDSIETGVFKLGMFYHNGTFNSLADPAKTVNGLWGIYFSGYQLLIPKELKELSGVGMFLQGGYAPGSHNKVDVYGSTGLNYKGKFISKRNNEITTGFVYSRISPDIRRAYSDVLLPNRMAVQLNVKFLVGNNCTIQPDVQYIINPGADKTQKNALISMLRFSLSY